MIIYIMIIRENIEIQNKQISNLYLRRGDTNASLSNYNPAIDDFKKSLEFNPENQVTKDYLERILSLR